MVQCVGGKPTEKEKKLAVSKLQHNDSYLRSLPKTSYYQIFDLQKQLVERGRLRTHHELEAFYTCIKYNSQPSQLQSSLQDVRKKMLGSRSAADLTSQSKTSENKHPCTAEDREEADDVCCPRLLEKCSGPGESSTELIFGGSQEKDAIEPVFPKMKAPTFATLQPNIMRNFQSKMPDLTPEIPEQSTRAEVYLRRLRQMHRLCLTNMAFSQRLLDRERDSLCWQEEQGVQDLVLPGINPKQGKTSQTNQPPLSDLKQTRVQKTSMSPTAEQKDPVQTLVLDTAVCGRKIPDPLSIEDACQQKHIQILDRGFKLWRNTENKDH